MNLIRLILSLAVINSNSDNKIQKLNFDNISNDFLIKLTKNNSNIIKTEKIKFSDMHPYELDCVWSLGMHCRPAHYIEKYNLRFQAAPFDWMIGYSLQEVIKQIKTGFKDFFSEIEDETQKNDSTNHRSVRDKNGNTLSIHHFPKNISAENYKKTFRDMMIKRANKLDNIIKNSKNIGFIYESKKENLDEIVDFGKQISQIYKNLDNIIIFHIINSKDEDLKEVVKTTFDKVTIISIKLNDVNKKDRKDWKGNPYKWHNYVMKFISSSKIFEQNVVKSKLSRIIKI